MKKIILLILIILLIFYIIKFINNNEYFTTPINNNTNMSMLSKYNCQETEILKDKYFDTPIDVNVCNDNVTVNSYDDYSNINISEITNNTTQIDDKYFKINYYNSRDQDNKPIKLASIKSYLGLPDYITANIGNETNKNLGNLKYFQNNYNINIEQQLKDKLVPVSYNYIIDND